MPNVPCSIDITIPETHTVNGVTLFELPVSCLCQLLKTFRACLTCSVFWSQDYCASLLEFLEEVLVGSGRVAMRSMVK